MKVLFSWGTGVPPFLREKKIAKKVNIHSHTKTCRKYKTTCRFNMPKLPSYKTIIAKPLDKSISDEFSKHLQNKHAAVIKQVREVLNNEDEIKKILSEYPKEIETTMADALEGRRKRIDQYFNKTTLP